MPEDDVLHSYLRENLKSYIDTVRFSCLLHPSLVTTYNYTLRRLCRSLKGLERGTLRFRWISFPRGIPKRDGEVVDPLNHLIVINWTQHRAAGPQLSFRATKWALKLKRIALYFVNLSRKKNSIIKSQLFQAFWLRPHTCVQRSLERKRFYRLLPRGPISYIVIEVEGYIIRLVYSKISVLQRNRSLCIIPLPFEKSNPQPQAFVDLSDIYFLRELLYLIAFISDYLQKVYPSLCQIERNETWS
jgi:hypothetical protein